MIFLSPTSFTWFLSQSKSVLVWQLHRLQLSLLDFLVELKTVCSGAANVLCTVEHSTDLGPGVVYVDPVGLGEEIQGLCTT